MHPDTKAAIELLTQRPNIPIAKYVLGSILWGLAYSVSGTAVFVFFWWLINELVSGI